MRLLLEDEILRVTGASGICHCYYSANDLDELNVAEYLCAEVCCNTRHGFSYAWEEIGVGVMTPVGLMTSGAVVVRARCDEYKNLISQIGEFRKKGWSRNQIYNRFKSVKGCLVPK